MKRSFTPVAGAALLAVLFLSLSHGQTKLDMRSQARNVDFSKAGSTSPFPVGTALPAVCTTGQTFFRADAAPGQNIYLCTGTNIWTAVEGGASLPSQSSNGGKLLGTNGAAINWRSLPGFTDNGSRIIPDGTMLAELSGNNVWAGQQRFPAAPTQTLNAGSNTIVCKRRTVAITAPTPLTLASTATIPDGGDGQVCVIVNVGSNPVTIQDQASLPGSNLRLNTARVTIPGGAQITLQYNATVGDWIQEGISSAAAAGLQDTNTSGMVVQTGPSGVTAARSITGTNGVNVTNGTGVSGDPTISIPGSSKGDLIVHNGANNVRLPLGGLGQTLVANSSLPAGLGWATRTVSGSNGLSVANGDWSSGTAAVISLPGSNKGDLLVHNGTEYTRIAAGAEGTVLQTDSSQSEGLKWAPKTPLTTKGDIQTFSTVPTRLDVGADGQVLQADSSQTSGLKWTALTYTNWEDFYVGVASSNSLVSPPRISANSGWVAGGPTAITGARLTGYWTLSDEAATSNAVISGYMGGAPITNMKVRVIYTGNTFTGNIAFRVAAACTGSAANVNSTTFTTPAFTVVTPVSNAANNSGKRFIEFDNVLNGVTCANDDEWFLKLERGLNADGDTHTGTMVIHKIAIGTTRRLQ